MWWAKFFSFWSWTNIQLGLVENHWKTREKIFKLILFCCFFLLLSGWIYFCFQPCRWHRIASTSKSFFRNRLDPFILSYLIPGILVLSHCNLCDRSFVLFQCNIEVATSAVLETRAGELIDTIDDSQWISNNFCSLLMGTAWRRLVTSKKMLKNRRRMSLMTTGDPWSILTER